MATLLPGKEGLSISGRPLSLPLRDVRALAGRMTEHFAPCGTLPSTALSGDVSALTRHCLEFAIAALDGEDTARPVARIERAAEAWAREGIPIDTVNRAVHAGFRLGLDMVTSAATARRNGLDSEDFANLVDGIKLVLDLLDTVTSTVGKAYIRQLRAVAKHHHTSVHILTSALLSGHATETMAEDCGRMIADRYAVLALHIPPHPDQSDPKLDAVVVGRRVLRRVQAALADRAEIGALALLSVDGGTLLVPADHLPGTDLDALVGLMSAAAGVELTATTITVEQHRVPEAADQTHRLLDTALLLGRRGGVFRFEQLALQYQIARPGPARDILARVLDPLRPHPELLYTLRLYLQLDGNRRIVSQRLGKHPNSLDHRLKRITKLTGHDPARSDGAWMLGAAMVATATGLPGKPGGVPSGVPRPYRETP